MVAVICWPARPLRAAFGYAVGLVPAVRRGPAGRRAGRGPGGPGVRLGRAACRRTGRPRRAWPEAAGPANSDADQLGWLTGVPAAVWVTLFALFALAALVLGARLLIPWPVHLPGTRQLRPVQRLSSGG